jgi:hypothetical protein
MGGQCAPGKNGWEIGVYGHEVTDAGKYWWTGDVSGQGGKERVVSDPSYAAHPTVHSTNGAQWPYSANKSIEITFQSYPPVFSCSSNPKNIPSIP